MKRMVQISFLGMALATVMLMAGCPAGGAGVPDPGAAGGLAGRGSGKVDPNTCGNYAANDAGRKLKAFLEATVKLDAAVSSTEKTVREACSKMASELGLSGLPDNTREMCMAVSQGLRDSLQGGLKAGAQLTINYKPAECRVSADVAASAAAQCEAKAEADVQVRCSGTCSGTCSGRCNGTCAAKGANGQCNGECSGTCEGSCSGGCEGHAEVEAEASCKAEAEVRANVEAECTEPELDVRFDAGVVVDKSKVDAAVRAIKAGLPRLLVIQAKLQGPVRTAFVSWSKASGELVATGNDLVSSLGEQAMCVLGQIRAAAQMVAGIEASIDVQIEVSAEVSASASGGGSGSARGGAGAPAAN